MVHLTQQSGVRLGVVDHHYGGRVRNGRPSGASTPLLSHVSWHRVRHPSLGGVMEFTSLFGLTNLEVEPSSSSLRRSIRHILEFGIRPFYAPGCSPPSRTHYRVDDRLWPGSYGLPVYHHTTFFASGWGSRSLSNTELMAAHGFPRSVAPGALVDFSLLFNAPEWSLNPIEDTNQTTMQQ
jgi:hypothetical protein